MHVDSMDSYCARASWLHRLDARIKLILTLAFVLTVSLTPTGSWPTYVFLYSLLLAATVASELSLGLVLRRGLVALLFVMAALPLLVTTAGRAVLPISVGRWSLAVTASGLERFLSIAVKSWLSVQAAVLLTATTRMPDLLVAMRALKLPRLLIATVSLMWRYLFVLADETMRMLRARTSRSAALDGRGGGSLFWRASVTGAMAGTLFLRGYERSERIYNAMLARGYDGSVRAATQRPLTRGERDIVVVGLVVLASVLTLGRFVG